MVRRSERLFAEARRSGAPETRTFPYIFPPEIRNHIYKYVLGSPSGVITLSRSQYRQRPIRYRIYTCEGENATYWESPGAPEEIHISFLRTCKAIYEECRELLWVYNTLDIESLRHETKKDGGLAKSLHKGIRHNVRSVALDADLLTALGDFEETIQRLYRWSWTQDGKMRSVTLNLRDKFSDNPWVLSHKNLRKLVKLRTLAMRPYSQTNSEPESDSDSPAQHPVIYHDCLDMMSESRQDGALSDVARRICIKTENAKWSKRQGFPRRVIMANEGDPEALLKDFSRAWNAEVEMDGVVCYRNGECLDETWYEGSVYPNEERAHVYRQDVDEWLAVRSYLLRRNRPLDFETPRILKEISTPGVLRDEVLKEWEESQDALEEEARKQGIDSSDENKMIAFSIQHSLNQPKVSV